MIRYRLREARIAAGLTQESAALLAGVERNTVNRYERGRRRPSLQVVVALAEVYGRPLDWFLQGTEVLEGDLDKEAWNENVQGLVFGGHATLEFKGTAVLRGGFSEVVGGFGMRFVGVAQVSCVAEEGLAEFDDRVVGMVPFSEGAFESQGVDPGSCNVVVVGGRGGPGLIEPGSMVLVDRASVALVDGGSYLLYGPEGVVVRTVRDGGGWKVDCGLGGLRPFCDGFAVIGVVRWVGRWMLQPF